MRPVTDYAWAAGFWDGEGSVSLSYRGVHSNPRIMVQVAQVDREVLDRFRDIVGYGNVLGPYAQRTANSQPYHVWRVEGVNHLRTIRDLLAPYLGTVKLKQMDDALQARLTWEESGQCLKGHRLNKSPKGKWRCIECQSIQGKINAEARWSKQKDMVI